MQSYPEIQGFALPTVVDPPDTVCVQINVPNDPAHIQAFLGVLYDLTLWISWQRDAAHTGILAAQVWKPIWVNLAAQFGQNCPIPITIFEEDFDDMSLCDQIRFENGVLQVLCCGVWTDVSGQASQGIGGPGQPGDGIGVPAASQCQTYNAGMTGNGSWVLPYPVSAGDTIAVTNENGAWQDPTQDGVIWRVPDGLQYFLGSAIPGTTTTKSGDPLNTKPHMSIICKIGSSYYDFSAGTLTVPGGVSNAQVTFQANDNVLSDNYGAITFDVTACNNQAVSWTKDLDFTQSPWNFVHNGLSGQAIGVWQAGIGWVNSDDGPDGSNDYYRGVLIQRLSLTPFTCTKLEIKYAYTKGAAAAGGVDSLVLRTLNAGSPISYALIPWSSDSSGTKDLVYVATNASQTGLYILIVSDESSGGGIGGFTGAVTLTHLIVSGTGPQPAW